MRSDAIILGAELDGLLAATHLLERGFSVQMLSQGASSLHHAPAGVHLLGFAGPMGAERVTDPFGAMGALAPSHPYAKLGARVVSEALAWFHDLCDRIGCPFDLAAQNLTALSPIGLGAPIAGRFAHQATHEALRGKVVALVSLDRLRDLSCDLLAAALKWNGVSAHVIAAPLPGPVHEPVALAKSFDTLADPHAYFSALKPKLPKGAQVALFPAILGLDRHLQVVAAAEATLGLPCLEVPLLPPSVPGLRLEHALRRHLDGLAVETNANIRIDRTEALAQGIRIHDAQGRLHEAKVAVLATGGVLMGGIEVQSTGLARETLFDLPIHQGAPLQAADVEQTLAALHLTGVETGATLTPAGLRNIFVTGRSLAHWNPSEESSLEGVALATGWFAARQACRLLERNLDD